MNVLFSGSTCPQGSTPIAAALRTQNCKLSEQPQLTFRQWRGNRGLRALTQAQGQPRGADGFASHRFADARCQCPDFHAIFGTADAGIQQCAVEQLTGLFRQYQQHLGELRTLALVHGHGEGAVVAGQARRREGTETVGAFEENSQAVSVLQTQADIAIEQAEGVIILSYHHRTARVPALTIGQAQAAFDPRLKCSIQADFTKAALTLGAQYPKGVEGIEGDGRVSLARYLKIGLITLVNALQQAAGSGLVVPVQINPVLLQQAQGAADIALIDPPRQFADTAVAGKTVADGSAAPRWRRDVRWAFPRSPAER